MSEAERTGMPRSAEIGGGRRPEHSVLADRLDDVRRRIRAAAGRAGRDPTDVMLVAVSKTFGADVLFEAIAAGITDVGENRAQELKEKMAMIGEAVRWHFVGPLQTNKVRHVVGPVALVHSVDRFGLAEAIDRRARALDLVQDVLIEVNIGAEPTKHGVAPDETVAFAEAVDDLSNVEVKGLMAIPPSVANPDDARPYFRSLVESKEKLQRQLPQAIELSMGMSSDFEVAVEEGATIVRVGEAIFGPRR